MGRVFLELLLDIQLVVINTRIKDVENASVKHAVVEESTYGT